MKKRKNIRIPFPRNLSSHKKKDKKNGKKKISFISEEQFDKKPLQSVLKKSKHIPKNNPGSVDSVHSKHPINRTDNSVKSSTQRVNNPKVLSKEERSKNRMQNYRMLQGSQNHIEKLCSTRTYDCLLILTSAALVKAYTPEMKYNTSRKRETREIKTTGLQLCAADLPEKWDISMLPHLEYAATEWRFDKNTTRHVVIKMPDGNYLIWRLLQNPYRFEMEQVTNPTTVPESKLFRDLHMAFHELEAKYQTLIRLVAGEKFEESKK